MSEKEWNKSKINICHKTIYCAFKNCEDCKFRKTALAKYG